MKIPLSSPDITDIERKAVIEVLNTPFLSLGPKIPQFENIMSAYAEVDHAVAMSSGTAVLHVLVEALNVGEGDIVLTTPFSFISTANCILYTRGRPLFVDIDKHTYNLTPEGVEDLFLSLSAEEKKRVKGVIYTDVFGVPADGPAFEELATKYGWFLIEDSAEALGSSIKNRKCGSFGSAALFAFYPNKQITTGEGGMLLTNDRKLAEKARSLRNQGRDEDAGWLQHARLGFNYRLSDIAAALGIAQMGRIEEIIEKRNKVKSYYDGFFQDLFKTKILSPQLSLPQSEVSPFVYVLKINSDFNRQQRDDLLDFLRKRGVQCSNYFSPIHIQAPYRDLGWKFGSLPIAEEISERTVALPFFTDMAESQIEYVSNCLKMFFK